MTYDDRSHHLKRQIDEVFVHPRQHWQRWFLVGAGFLGLMILKTELQGYQSEQPLYSQSGKEICIKSPMFGMEKCRTEGTGEKHDRQ